MAGGIHDGDRHGDIYDAWRAQDLNWLASYLPDDFCHVIYIPTEVHPLGGLCRGKKAAIERLSLIASQFDFLSFDTSDLIIQKNRAGLEIQSATAIARRAPILRR